MDPDGALPLPSWLRRFAAAAARAASGALALAALPTVVCSLLIAPPVHATPTDPLASTAGVIGLMPLPEVFGADGCAPFTAKDIPVHALPDRIGRSLLTLHAAPARAPSAPGNCMPRRARVSPPGNRTGPELPTVEIGNEEPAAIVLERRQRWYRIALPADSGWIRVDDNRRFVPITRLLSTRMTYLRSGALLPLPPEPGRASAAAAGPLASDVPVRVVSTRRLDGVLWLQVDTRDAEACGQPAASAISGWLPLLDERRQGVPSVWFRSRGC